MCCFSNAPPLPVPFCDPCTFPCPAPRTGHVPPTHAVLEPNANSVQSGKLLDALRELVNARIGDACTDLCLLHSTQREKRFHQIAIDYVRRVDSLAVVRKCAPRNMRKAADALDNLGELHLHFKQKLEFILRTIHDRRYDRMP